MAYSISNSIKRVTVIVHDLGMTLVALALSIFLRWPLAEIEPRLSAYMTVLPLFIIYAGLIYRGFALYRSKWRFASLPDLFNIFKAASVLAVSMLALDYALVARGMVPVFLFGEKAAFLYWILQMFFLGGPRLAYRYFKYVQSRRTGERDVASVIVLGRSAEAEVVLRAMESGMRHRFIARAVLSPRRTDHGISIRGVPVLGDYNELERLFGEFADNNMPVTRVIFAPFEFTPDAESERLLATARRLGIEVLRMQTVSDDEQETPALAPVQIEDLLFRPSVEVDRKKLAAFLAGKKVVVTGGGGSIGSEICHRVIAFGASDLMILDNGEPALHAILEDLATHPHATRVRGVLADVRDGGRLTQLFEAFQPDFVFHAAALKQLPFLETDWSEGVKTNVFGSAHVVDAARMARAIVTISTDKAVDPVSILGATKRMSEIHAQTMDAQARAEGREQRVISVRFGNVLGSAGSVVPKFKAQIARGGPVTVTHPDMVRYFMTVREACDLVLTASAHAVEAGHEGEDHASVYVLKMGQPARIVDLATRMIRLAGFEPGKDIAIEFTGSRPGERLNEYLFAADEPAVDIGVAGVTAARTPLIDKARLERWYAALRNAVQADRRADAEAALAEAIPSFRKRAGALNEAAAPFVVQGGNVTDISTARRAGTT